MKLSVFCVVDSQREAADVVSALRSAGFADGNISLLFPDEGAPRDTTFAPGSPARVRAGLLAGAATGGVVASVASLAATTIPWADLALTPAAVFAALAAAAIGTILGGVVGGLIGLGLTSVRRPSHATPLREGQMVASARCHDDDQASAAKSVFASAGAHGVFSVNELRPPSRLVQPVPA